MSTKIYIAYHKMAPRIQGGAFVPIHVGRALANAPLAQMVGDDTGTHISDANGAWCELTALYWAWKNDSDSDRIGLMHYRRVLDVQNSGMRGRAETQVGAFDVDDWIKHANLWLETADFDIIVPRLHVMGRTVEANYKHTHNGEDWDAMRGVIAADYPQYLPAFDKVAADNQIRLGNIVVMTRPLLDQYCGMLFDVLGQVENADVDRRNYRSYQQRYLGFLAERLLTVFVEHLRQTCPHLKVKELGILKLDQALVTPFLAKPDSPSPRSVNIALSADREYLPHAAAMLRSVLDHADSTRDLNVFFLHSGIETRDLNMLHRMLIDARPTLSFHPINTGAAFEKSYRSASRAPSNATYNRFLLFSLLPHVDRLLYLDCDMIINRDICDLFDTPMGQSQIAAVPDWIMTRTLTGAIPTADPNVPDLRAYHHETLGLSDAEIAQYFNAGVLLFNFAAMENPKAIGEVLLKEAQTGRYMFRDQDILNMAFKGVLHILDARWNVFNSDEGSFGRVPGRLWDAAKAAREDPWIVHFADRSFKPWGAQAVPWADKYWQAAVRTPFFRNAKPARNLPSAPRSPEPYVKWGRTIAARLPVLRRPLLWAYRLLRRPN